MAVSWRVSRLVASSLRCTCRPTITPIYVASMTPLSSLPAPMVLPIARCASTNSDSTASSPASPIVTSTNTNTSSSVASSSSVSTSVSAGERRAARIYTRTGDNGTSLLFNLSRLAKDSGYFHALGTIDELNAHIGVAREHCPPSSSLAPLLTNIQSRLLDLGSHIATPIRTSTPKQLERTRVDQQWVDGLEAEIDSMQATLPPLTNFILPSGGLASSSLHVARTVCRRAEREVVTLVRDGDADRVAVLYLNRLSDFLFVAARFSAARDGHTEVVYKKSRPSSSS